MSKYFAVPILSLTLFAASANAQFRTLPTNLQQFEKGATERTAATNNFYGSPQEQFDRQQIGIVAAQRHAQLRIDTEKLVALTAELKQHVDRTGINILSMDVIKKAQEIQKLAKSVQDKMKNAY